MVEIIFCRMYARKVRDTSERKLKKTIYIYRNIKRINDRSYGTHRSSKVEKLLLVAGELETATRRFTLRKAGKVNTWKKN